MLTRKGFIFLIVGLVIQIVTYFITSSSILSLVSGLSGVFSVVLCSEKKISMYAFGFVQLFTYIALCIVHNLYGEIIENSFYFITMIIGIIIWKQNYDNDKNEVIVKKISLRNWIILIIGTVIVSLCFGTILNYTDDTEPYLDAFSTVPAFVAQILMILRYKEQWYFWIIVDILTMILWLEVGNYCMAMQHLYWLINCFYGLKNWK